MAFFQYRAADQAGKVVDGVMEADAEQSVILRLREMGCVPLRIALPSERAVGAVRQPLCRCSKAQGQPATAPAVYPRARHVAQRRLPLDRSLSILGGSGRGRRIEQGFALAGRSGARRANLWPLPWASIPTCFRKFTST